MRAVITTSSLLVFVACAGTRAEPVMPGDPAPTQPIAAKPAPPPTVVDDESVVAWATLRGEIEALVCARTLDLPDGRTLEEPWYGEREVCGRDAPGTAIARAVEASFVAARPALISLTEQRAAARAALKATPAEGRLAAMRDAYLDEVFLGMLLPRLFDALEAEGLTCRDCPVPVRPPRREVEWATVQPYLVAHVWPDPVVTPRDARGRPTGKPKLSVHVCVGTNGIAEIAEPEPALIRAAYLGTFHTRPLLEHVQPTVKAVTAERAYGKLRTDDARTEHLRAQLGPRVLAEPQVRAAVCETLRRFEPDTGIVVIDCDPAKPSATAPKATPPKTAAPATATPLVPPSAASFHKGHAVTPAELAKLAPASPGARIDRAHVAPGAAPTEDPGENAKGDAAGDERSPAAPSSSEPE